MKQVREAILQHAVQTYQKGGVLLYPTATVWGLGCDARNPEAVQRIYQLKQREESKALIVLLSDVHQLHDYVEHVPDKALELIIQSERPTTIIYEKAKNLSPNLIAEDGSIAIRITNHHFCKSLIREVGGPLVSTSANISGLATSALFEEVDLRIIQGVDIAVRWDLLEFQTRKNINARPSRILKVTPDEQVLVIRD